MYLTVEDNYEARLGFDWPEGNWGECSFVLGIKGETFRKSGVLG